MKMKFMAVAAVLALNVACHCEESVAAQKRIEKPLDIKFQAVDGREVDLAAMKGKVVLVVFWATWCGPCIAEVPHIKSVYSKFHDKGFEIIGISLDKQKENLMKFAKMNSMPWPQYFDGKGWENAFAVKYEIEGVPTLWLVDKQGNCSRCNLNGCPGLAEKVEELLGAAKPEAKPDNR